MEETRNSQQVREYTLPNGCPACSGDLPVRVSPAGPRGVCPTCQIVVKPFVRLTAKGLSVEFEAAAA